jgi:hypothetical protein
VKASQARFFGGLAWLTKNGARFRLDGATCDYLHAIAVEAEHESLLARYSRHAVAKSSVTYAHGLAQESGRGFQRGQCLKARLDRHIVARAVESLPT